MGMGSNCALVRAGSEGKVTSTTRCLYSTTLGLILSVGVCVLLSHNCPVQTREAPLSFKLNWIVQGSWNPKAGIKPANEVSQMSKWLYCVAGTHRHCAVLECTHTHTYTSSI